MLEESQRDPFQQWEHLSALPFPRSRRKDLSHTDESTLLFLPAPGTGLASPEPPETMFTTKKQWWLASPAALVNTTREATSARDGSPRPRTLIASSPGDMNLSLLNNANRYPDAGNPTRCENNKNHWDCASGSALFGTKLFWRDLYLGSMTVMGIHRQIAWDPLSRRGLKKQNKNNLRSTYFT